MPIRRSNLRSGKWRIRNVTANDNNFNAAVAISAACDKPLRVGKPLTIM